MSYFIGIVILAAVFLFPIFINGYVFWDSEKKKAGFAVYLAGIVKLLSGYAQLYGEGIAFHITRKTAILLPYADILAARKKFEITRGFVICRYRQIIELGGENYAAAAVALSLIMRKITDLVFRFLQRKKDVNLGGDVVLDMNRSGVRVTVSAVIAFNLLILAVAAVKIILERILEYGRKRKKQAGR